MIKYRADTSAIFAASALARIAHAGQEYGDGTDYYTGHVLNVVSRINSAPGHTTEHTLVGYLHDVVEDTAVTLSDLQDFGFSPDVVAAVGAITRRKGEVYADFIDRVGTNAIARFVKIYDLMENLSNDPKPSQKTRYEKALGVLEVRSSLALEGY